MTLLKDYVEVLTPSGAVTIDVTASDEAGMLRSDPDNAGDAIAAVRRAIEDGDGMFTRYGNLALICPPVGAYVYRRAER